MTAHLQLFDRASAAREDAPASEQAASSPGDRAYWNARHGQRDVSDAWAYMRAGGVVTSVGFNEISDATERAQVAGQQAYIRALDAWFELERVGISFGTYSEENPPSYERLRELIQDSGLSRDAILVLMVHCNMPHDSTLTGNYEPSTPLRDGSTVEEYEGEDLGVESDSLLGMGEAESWFREHREETPNGATEATEETRDP